MEAPAGVSCDSIPGIDTPLLQKPAGLEPADGSEEEEEDEPRTGKRDHLALVSNRFPSRYDGLQLPSGLEGPAKREQLLRTWM